MRPNSRAGTDTQRERDMLDIGTAQAAQTWRYRLPLPKERID
jgi:hypothetical protein